MVRFRNSSWISWRLIYSKVFILFFQFSICTIRYVKGLEYRNENDIWDLLNEWEFNALRLPISMQVLLEDLSPNWEAQHWNLEKLENSKFFGMKTIEIYETIVQEAGKRGILVLLDMRKLLFIYMLDYMC